MITTLRLIWIKLNRFLKTINTPIKIFNMLDHDKLQTLPDGDLRAFLKELEKDANFIEGLLAVRKAMANLNKQDNSPEH